MKILCVIDSLVVGGAQRQLVELAVSFKDMGHDVSFLTYHYFPFYSSILEDNEIYINCIQEHNYLRRLLKMRRLIRQGKYDAVLSFLEAANFICEIAGIPSRKWKLIVGERSANPEIRKRFKLRIYRWFHIFADYIVANSYANMQMVRSINPLLAKSKCLVIYNIVDFILFKPINNFTFRKDRKINLVIASRLHYQKNINGLIEAITLLNTEELSKIKIDWYGYSENQTNMEELLVEIIKKINNYGLENVISFHAATLDITKIIQNSDAVGLFSFYEGCPNVVCEAMACGKPVLCSNVSDVSRFIGHDYNLLCDPNNPQSIKQAISYLINLSNSQLNKIGTKNRIVAKNNFNREIIVKTYLHLLGDKTYDIKI